MGFALNLLLAATPPPGGDLREGLDPDQVSPGLTGFIATFAVVAVTILLILDMTRRIRRVRYGNSEQDAEGGVAPEGDGDTGERPSSSSRADGQMPRVRENDDGGRGPSRPSPDDPDRRG